MTDFWPNFAFYLLVGLLCIMPVFAVVFATARYGISRLRPQQPHPKRWALLTSALATPFLCWAGLHLVLFLYAYYPQRDFNSNAWVADQNKRYEMVGDLQASRLLIGLAPNQVSGLLGTPYSKEKTSWAYYLGIKPGLGFSDGTTIKLEFRNNKVVSTRIYQN